MITSASGLARSLSRPHADRRWCTNAVAVMWAGSAPHTPRRGRFAPRNPPKRVWVPVRRQRVMLPQPSSRPPVPSPYRPQPRARHEPLAPSCCWHDMPEGSREPAGFPGRGRGGDAPRNNEAARFPGRGRGGEAPAIARTSVAVPLLPSQWETSEAQRAGMQGVRAKLNKPHPIVSYINSGPSPVMLYSP